MIPRKKHPSDIARKPQNQQHRDILLAHDFQFQQQLKGGDICPVEQKNYQSPLSEQHLLACLPKFQTGLVEKILKMTISSSDSLQ